METERERINKSTYQAVAKTAALGMSMAQASNDDNGSGLDTRGAFGEGRDIFNESRKLAYRKRLEAEKGRDYVKNPKSTGRNLGRRSPRQNKIVGTTGRNAAKTTKTRAAFSKAKVKWNPYVSLELLRMLRSKEQNKERKLLCPNGRKVKLRV